MSTSWLGLPHFPELETPRLRLREIRETDFEFFHAMFKDEKLNEHIQIAWAEPSEARKVFDSWTTRFGKAEGARWSITLKDSGEWVGNFGFHNLRPETACAERGLQIVRAHWRKGFGREASGRAMEWLLSSTPFKNIDSWIALGNHSSINLVESQGFARTGELKPFGPLTLARYLRQGG
jgi:[ribosomal protein S5]-alanine N-acetyltransferase